MKSLEHIIRDIREGKCCCEKKKESLENSIRKVVRKESSYGAKDSKPVDEDIGGLIGSGTGGEPKMHAESSKKKVRKEDGDKLPGAEDKMDETISVVNPEPVGNQFKSVRTQTPHIKPPAGPGSHSQAPENVSRQRTFAKERVSQTMHRDMRAEEYYIQEGPKGEAVETILKGAEELFGFAKPSKFNAPVPYRAKVPAKPETKLPAKLAQPEVKTSTELKTITQPEVKTDTKLAPIDPKTETKTKVVSPELVKAGVITKTPEAISTKTAELPAVSPKTEVKTSPKEPNVVLPKTKGKGFPLPIPLPSSSKQDLETAYYDKWLQKPGGPSRAHKHKSFRAHMKEETRKDIENMPRPDAGDRKTIQYVGRKKSNTTIARQATIKNVIDESKKAQLVNKKERKEDSGKTKVFPTVIVNPDMNHVDSSSEVRS